MSFYQSIADYYHQIFPLSDMQVDFVKSSFHNLENLQLLDVGCGIGELSFALSNYFKKVIAIDLDLRMMERAKQEFQIKTDNLQFNKINMLDIEDVFGIKIFDAIICFGNTLVHLNGPNEILNFFKQAKQILNKNGKLLFQIINFDRIIDQKIMGLPTIENDKIQFIRNYHYDKQLHKIGFETQLLIKLTGQKINNLIYLYPIRKDEIKELLLQAGFTNFNFYGNFKKEKFTQSSIPLVVAAS